MVFGPPTTPRRLLLIFAARGRRVPAIQSLLLAPGTAVGMHSSAVAGATAARRAAAAVPAAAATSAAAARTPPPCLSRPWWWCARQRAGGLSLLARAAPSTAAADSSGGQQGQDADPAAAGAAPAPARGRPRRPRATAAAAAAPPPSAASAASSASDDVPPPAAPAPARRRTTRRVEPAAASTEAAVAASAPPAAAAAAPAPKKPRAPRSPTAASKTTTATRAAAAAAAAPAVDDAAAPSKEDHDENNSDDESPAPRLYIIDLLAQAHRMLHGMAPAALSTADGATRTGVAHGLAQLVLSLLRRRSRAPTHMAVVVDAPGATWRHERYPQYKAQRLPSPPGFREEVGRALELLSALGLPVLAVPGVEADDVVASLAVRALRARGGTAGAGATAAAAAAEGGGAPLSPSSLSSSSPSPQPPPFFADVVIVSPDKDFFQLLSLDRRLSLLRLVKSGAEGNTGAGGGADGGRFTDAGDFLRLRPELEPWGCGAWADVLALMGDASDNVPGVRGVGEKTALALVGACGGLEAVLEAARAAAEEEEKEQKEKEKAAAEEGGPKKRRGGGARKSEALASAAAPSSANPLAAVKLNRKQREVLASAEGRAAARLALELVTVQADLRVPPLRDLGPFDGGGEEGEGEGEGGEGASSAGSAATAGDLREALRLRVPSDGGARLMAVFDALEMRKAAEQYSRLLQKWAGEGRV